MASSSSAKTCYYELLGVDRKCDAAEIKTSYRKLALRMHPDKAAQHGLSVEEATAKFQKVQEAYSVLSDPQERAWYDAHREQILRGDDEPGEDPFKTKINLYKYFSTSCFDGFGDGSRGFFAVYTELFEAIDAEEEQWEDADEDHVAMPPFGRSDMEWPDVSNFYRHWLDFCSRKAFGHADQWNPKEAQNRQVRRAMEQENKKARQAAKKEFNAEVRQLVKFVQKRDPRVAAHEKQQMKERVEKTQREKAEKDRKKKDEAKEREQRQVAARQAQEERWAEARSLKEAARARGEVVSEDEDEDGSDEEEQVEYTCEACRKSFKSEKAYDQHAKSKKHLQIVAQLRRQLEKEMREEEQRKAKEKAARGEDEDDDEESDEDDDEQDDESDGSKENKESDAKDLQNNGKSVKEGAEESEGSEESEEDDFVARFAAQKQKGRGGAHGRGRGAGGYPAAAEEPGSSDNDEESDDKASEEEEAAGKSASRGTRAQKREQQMAILLQRQQERENVQNLVNGARKAQKANKNEGAASPGVHDGPIPEGNRCGVCNEEFPSRSALFKHIKATGHAMLKPAADEAPKGRKKKR